MILLFVGKAGTGKGTQAQMLVQETGLLSVSMGELLRNEIEKKTEVGKQIESEVKAGLLVPAGVTAQLIENWMDSNDLSKGFIFDGFPRSIEQARLLEKILEKKRMKVDKVLNFTVPEKALIKRVHAL